MEHVSHSFSGICLLVLTFIVPLFVLFVALKRTQNTSKKSLFIIIGLQMLLSGAGYLTLKTGELDEERVEGVVEKKLIQKHESTAEIMTGLNTIATILSFTAIFITLQWQSKVLIAVSTLGLLAGSLGIAVRSQGVELVRSRIKAPAYDIKSQGHLQKLPGNFSSRPSENESLKRDDNDYEGTEELEQNEDDEKQED